MDGEEPSAKSTGGRPIWGDPEYEYAVVPSGAPDRFPEWERLAAELDGKVHWRRKKGV